MRFSKYIRKISFDEKYTIIYNTYNESLVLLENEIIDGKKTLSEDETQQLSEMGFFSDSKEVDAEYTHFISQVQNNTLRIIIELTEKCNFDCIYCYQKPWEKLPSISYETLELIMKYVSNRLATGQYKVLDISYFGGEPLLEQKKIRDSYSQFKKICEANNVELRILITSNCYLLTRSFLSEFQNVRIATTLSDQNDHDSKRFLFDGGLSYGKIVENLKACKDLFETEQYRLEIRYNTDARNIGEFEKFITNIVIPNFGRKTIVKPAYTFEHEQSKYLNTLPFREFQVWNSSQAIDILVKNDMQVAYKPAHRVIPCSAYFDYNIKVFADGYLGLCDSFFPSRKQFTISELVDNPARIYEMFPEKKQILIESSMCQACSDRFFCGGYTFCKEKPCDNGFVNVDEYLRSYVRAMFAGKDYLFL